MPEDTLSSWDYKTTTDYSDAIKDIIVLEGPDYNSKQAITHNGRTYYQCPHDGRGDFNKYGGNLNHGCKGSSELHFYYTKQESSDKMAVHSLWVDTESAFSVSGMDLNKKAGGDFIYLHLWRMDNQGRTYINDVPGRAWMSYIPDNVKITDLSIPGTHDSGTNNVYLYGGQWWAICQNHNIGHLWSNGIDEGQLNYGIRYLDIRYGYDSDKKNNSHIRLVHSGWRCQYFAKDRSEEDIVNSVLMNWLKTFLDENPTETVILDIADDDDNNDKKPKTQQSAYEFWKAQAQNPNRSYPSVYVGDHVPTMGETRGKVVILADIGSHDYSLTRNGKKVYWAFPNSYTTGDEKNQTFGQAAAGSEQHYIIYKDNKWGGTDINGKKTWISNGLRDTGVIHDREKSSGTDAFMLLYTSANSVLNQPWQFAAKINPMLLDYVNQHSGSYLGILAMDFPLTDLSKAGAPERVKTSPKKLDLVYGIFRTNFRGAIPHYESDAMQIPSSPIRPDIVLPKTGDNGHPVLWLLLVFIGAAGIIAGVISRRRQKSSGK